MGREEKLASTRFVSASVCRLTYGAATALIALVFRFPPSESKYLTGLAAHVASTCLIYVFSFFSSNSSLYDPAWCVLPICLAIGWMSTSGAFPSARGWYGLGALLLWFARYNVFYPWDGWTAGLQSEDWRYGMIAQATGSGSRLYWLVSFTSLHQTPTLLVWFALSTAMSAWTSVAGAAPPLGPWDVLAAGTMALAVLVQAWADADLRAFRREAYGPSANLMTASGSRQVCRRGLWHFSRHPNYFGEWLFWVGVAVLGLAAEDAPRPWLARWGGAAGMLAFFRGAAALMDGRMMRNRPAEFGREMRCTSALIPMPRFG